MKTKIVFWVLMALCLICSPLSSFASDKSKIQRQFGSWLNSSLWPDAKRIGVSKPVFRQAFDGVKLRWDLPDLVIPGAKAKKTRLKVRLNFVALPFISPKVIWFLRQSPGGLCTKNGVIHW